MRSQKCVTAVTIRILEGNNDPSVRVQNAQVPSNMLESLKSNHTEVQRVKPLSIAGGAADSSKLREKFVQRGAASFVAQLRDTKENSDMLVSLILTKEMLLVAKKPTYKTMYTLKYAGGLKAFLVPKDQNGVIVISSELDEPLMFGCGQAKLFQETLEAFVSMSGCSNPNPLSRPEGAAQAGGGAGAADIGAASETACH